MFGGKGAFSLILLLMIITDVHRCSALPMPHGINYLGVGYNILDGNPEGDEGIGGVDPGLLISRRVFAFNMNGKLSSDQQYQIPDEVFFLHRSSSQSSQSRTTFHSTSSYAAKLTTKVEAEGSYSGAFASVEFAASTRYERVEDRIDSQRSVFYASETVTNLGNARYLNERALPDRYGLDNGFVAAACRLPNVYDQELYMDFMDDWGTHVVTELDLGTRVGQNYVEERSSFTAYASTHVDASISVSGSYGVYSGSIGVDMDAFNSGMDAGTSFGSMFSSYHVGSSSLNEPISLTLIGMNEVFAVDYWTRMSDYIPSYCTDSFQMETVGNNMWTAMQAYASFRHISPSIDEPVVIPLTWPRGQYGLPQPRDGCPNTQFTWDTGSRYHDTEDSNPSNEWSSTLHLQGSWRSSSMEHHFCIKTVAGDQSTWAWQPGSYCIYKYGAGESCPAGFEEGYIYWDDEDSSNGNRISDVLPSGTYGGNTRINFCCRNDEHTDHAIYLPTDDNFFLFPRHGTNCQEVHGMTVTNEYFRWDNEGNSNGDSQSEVHPSVGVQSGAFVRLNFCYYTPRHVGWPDGTYGLPKPTDGCPLTWLEGHRYHDTEDNAADNQWSDPLHLAGSKSRTDMEHHFCIKFLSNTLSGQSQGDWPEGEYCIYKYGSCPTGFQASWIKWDDEDDNNANRHGGTVPNGIYNHDTQIEFCCRSDGATNEAIDLPKDDNFYLFSRTDNCQEVNGMWVTDEWFYWDTEDNNNIDRETSVHPYEGIIARGENIKIKFCYYHRD